jgi:hypothetical protein
MKRKFAATILSALAVSGALVVGAPSAQATEYAINGTCGDAPFDVYIVGAEAHWTVTCAGGRVRLNGRVDDTRADGRCAEVKGVFSDHVGYARNCPATSPPTYFDWTGPGNTVYGYLYLV